MASRRPSAVVRAQHGAPAIRLAGADNTTLQEALRLAEDLREELETSVLSYGRWLLGTVFANDARAALDDKSDNKVWQELVRRAGGPTLRLSRTLLYNALRIAAYDKRITDQSWRGLDVGRKERLLPLGDDSLIRQAATHVSKFDLSQTKAKEYVTQLLAIGGKKRQTRLSGALVTTRMGRMNSWLSHVVSAKQLRMLASTMKDDQKARVREDVNKMRRDLEALLKALK